MTADVLAFSEVGSEQCLNDRILTTMLIGKPDEPVGINCVWRSFHLVEGKMNSFGFSDSEYFGIQFQLIAPSFRIFWCDILCD